MELPDKKQIEFMVVMLWVAVASAIVILVIDFQIKSAILKESEKAWGRIHAIGSGERGNSSTANSAGNLTGLVCDSDGTKMEMGNVPSDSAKQTGQSANGHREAIPKPRGRNQRVPRDGKQAP